MKKIEKLKKEARKNSTKEGAFATISSAFGNSYITPFAVAINASNSLIAMMSSIPGLVGPLSQLIHSRLIEKNSRKKIVTRAVFFEILTWIPLIAIALLFYKGIVTNLLPLMLLLFFSLYIIVANVGHPAWFSWVGDLIDSGKRGKWFAKRKFLLGTITLIFTILAALLLDLFAKNNLAIIGFISLFSLAAISRIISLIYLKKQYEPKLELHKTSYFSFFKFLKKSPKNNFGRFTIFRALTAFAVNIASPFFAIYMLKELHFSYLTFTIVTMSHVVFSILIIKTWGKFSDKYGNYDVLKINMILISIVPFLWMVSKSPIYLIFVPQLINGIAWAGFDLATGNFIFDSVTPEKRALAVSYFNVFRGVGVFLGAGLGAIIAKYITITFMNPIFFIFLLSGIINVIIGLTMLPFIEEIRETHKFKSLTIIKKLGYNIIKLPSSSRIHEFRFKNNKIVK